MTELDGLVERSRRLGADPKLVVHGGGNTSSKLLERDHLGRERLVLRIKASGADLATATADDFPGVYLDEVLELRNRDAMEDDELVAYLDQCRAGVSARRPSIETVLHAFLPATHVDHVHSDAICALTNTPGFEVAVAEALGEDVALVPYVRPGFALAKLVADVGPCSAIVLSHHGLVTWGETHDESLERTFALERRARDYLAEASSGRPVPDGVAGLDDDEEVLFLPQLRATLSRERPQILHVDRGQRDLADRADVEAVATAARSTPDHMLRIGRASAVVSAGSGEVDLGQARVVLVPGLGCVAAGLTSREARMRTEIAEHSHRSVAATLDAFGEVDWLDERESQEFIEWPLELAKLKLAPAPAELAGRIVVVTGAASGIGRTVAATLAALGAAVALADVDRDGLEETVAAIGDDTAIGVTADLTDEGDVDRFVRSTVKAFGGIDGVVSNAGVAVTGRIAELPAEDWAKSLAVNATSHFLLTKRVWPVLESQRLGGSLVYVASKNAFSPGAGFGAYSAAKAAEIQLARIAALEGGPARIRANAVNPDAIFRGSRLWSDDMRRERARSHGVEPEALEDFYASRTLLGHVTTSADVAEAVAFLISPRSAATTGCVITVDGGVPGAFPR